MSVLFFSSCSSRLSCRRRSFAHLANSSWLLVACRSRRHARNSFCSLRCSANSLECAVGKRFNNVHSYGGSAFRQPNCVPHCLRCAVETELARSLMAEAPMVLIK